MLRLFVAWPLPEGVGREIGRMTKELRAELPPASWPRPESIHLTFAFLGDTSEERASTIASALDSVACAAIPIRLGGVGVFPDERRPRVVWLGVDPAPPVVVLAGEIRRALAGVGATFDPKPFRPHLTVARIKRHGAPRMSELFARRSKAGRRRRRASIASFSIRAVSRRTAPCIQRCTRSRWRSSRSQ